mmetsp:Transcript_11377/g.29296  ORF Transcript_11377/g.29296 Transcript_11377/m.29296 type:complete len:223 (+) Transcript_11377:2-670(+)
MLVCLARMGTCPTCSMALRRCVAEHGKAHYSAMRHRGSSPGPVLLLELLHHEEHEDGVTATPHEIRSEAIVQGHWTFLGGDALQGLHEAGVRQLARRRVDPLRRHAVLRRLKGHGDHGVDQAGRERGSYDVGAPLDAEARIDGLELVIRSHLSGTHEASARHEGCGAAPEGGHALLGCDAGRAIHHTCVVPPVGHGIRRVVRQAHEGDLARASDVGGAAARG